MNTLTSDEQKRIADQVALEISLILKPHGIDFFALDKNVRDSYIETFQLGVKFIDRKVREESSYEPF